MNDFHIEIERYELYAGPAYRFDLGRRGFLKAFGSGLLVVCAIREATAQQRESSGNRRRGGEPAPREVSAWIHINNDGIVTAYTGKVEVGQNARTSLSQVVADELRVPLESVRLVMGDTELTPFDAGTFGSRTSPAMAPQLRRAAAGARRALTEIAAGQWKADVSALTAADGKVTNPVTGESIAYGALTCGQKLVKPIAEDIRVTPASDWKVAGGPARKVNGRAIVTGTHKFTADIQRPRMLYGRVLRPAAFEAKLASLDMSEAERIAGVAVVSDGDFAGACAPSEALAARAVKAFRTEWSAKPQPSDGELFEHLKRTASDARGSRHVVGSVSDALAAADKKLSHTYTVAYIAHVPLEPRAAVAEWNGDRLTVWTGTQRPFGVRGDLASAFGIPEQQVRVIVPDTGSGYGGKHTGEAAVEAARLAKAAGRPVRLVWTREEEFTWAYFRPAGVIEVSSGARKDGTLTAWEFHNYNSGGSAIRTLYDVPNQHIEFHGARSPLRHGSYRALAATANHFARETHMDELARALDLDPLEFRLKNLRDARLRDVLEAAAERFGWARRRANGNRGFGIAGGSEKGSYIASCAEVAVDRSAGSVRIVRVASAFECGAIINPDHLRNQVEGAIVQGIGGALFEAVRFENGRILNARLSQYRVPRFSDAPQLDTVLLDRKDLPSAGAGETPIVCLAPAAGNAIFDATGVRLRSMPMRLT